MVDDTSSIHHVNVVFRLDVRHSVSPTYLQRGGYHILIQSVQMEPHPTAFFYSFSKRPFHEEQPHENYILGSEAVKRFAHTEAASSILGLGLSTVCSRYYRLPH